MSAAAKKSFLRHAAFFFSLTGWLAALVLAGAVAPKVYQRLIFKVPPLREANWQQIIALRQAELTVPWLDQRPLILFAGDSQIEMGNWYDLFGGHWAVRNCGLSRAKITDVTALVGAMGDRHPRAVVVMCGINSLFARLPVETCARDYEILLANIRSHLEPEKILVLSVMPVRESPVDQAAHEVNLNVIRLNGRLESICKTNNIRFIDVAPVMADKRGGLAHELTSDGLHLNAEGYHRLSVAIAGDLPLP